MPVWLLVSLPTTVAWMANFWLELEVQSSTSITAPAAVLPPRTVMQRLVLVTLTKKLPLCTSGEIDQACWADPLQAAVTMPVPLVAAPASRHWPELLAGDRVQLLPARRHVEDGGGELGRGAVLLNRRCSGIDDHALGDGGRRGCTGSWCRTPACSCCCATR